MIQEYFSARPDGESVTLEVLREVGKDRLEQYVDGTRTFDRVKQDAGLLIAICLVKRYGREQVMTYRENDGHRVSTRAAGKDGPPWVNRYTPHRVLMDWPAERIVLDTSVVRSHFARDDHRLDLRELLERKCGYPVSITDPSFLELLAALLRKDGLAWEQWKAGVRELSNVLDPEFPIVPVGRELTALTEPSLVKGFDLGRTKAYYRAVWHYTSTATSVEDFGRELEFAYPDGGKFVLGPLSAQLVHQNWVDHRENWTRLMKTISRLSFSEPPTREQAADLVSDMLQATLTVQQIDRLDLVVKSFGVLAERTLTRKSRVDPNDAFDFDLLYTVSLPGVVCTLDKRLVQIARESEAADSWRVMKPEQLLKWFEERVSVHFHAVREWLQNEDEKEPHIKDFHLRLRIQKETASKLLHQWQELGLVEHRFGGYILSHLGKSAPRVRGLTVGDLLQMEECQLFVDGEALVWWTGEASIRASKTSGELRFLLRWNRTVGIEDQNSIGATSFIHQNAGGGGRASLWPIYEQMLADLEPIIGDLEVGTHTETVDGVSRRNTEMEISLKLELGFDKVLEHFAGSAGNAEK